MDFQEAVEGRKSIRFFTDETVPEKDIRQMINKEIRISFSVGNILLHYKTTGQANPTLKNRLWPDSPRAEEKQTAIKDQPGVLRLRACKLNKEAN